MVRELVFHLGDCKTGSTSIQVTLARKAWHCPERSLVYPAVFNHIPLARTLTDDPPDGGEHQWAQIARRMAHEKADIGIVSAEHFEFVDPRKLAQQIERHFGAWKGRIRLISYIRPHPERFLSTFAERSKLGSGAKSMEHVLDLVERDGRFHYLPRVSRWRETFGDAFTVRLFLRDRLKDGDVVRDFFDFVLEGREVDFTGLTNQNESLSVEDLTILREIQRRVRMRNTNKFNDAQEVLGRHLAHFMTGTPATGATKLRLHRSLAERIAGIYAEDAQAMDEAFFEGTPMADRLSNAVQTAIAEPISLDPEDYHDPSTLRLVEIWSDFLSHMMQADKPHFMWACRPSEFRHPKPPAERKQPPAPQRPSGRYDSLKEVVAAILPAPLDRRLRRAWRALRIG